MDPRLLHLKTVYPHHDAPAAFYIFLKLVGRVLDLALDPAAFDGPQGPALALDFGQVIARPLLDAVRQLLDVDAARQGVRAC